MSFGTTPMTFATIATVDAEEFIERLTTYEEDRHLFRGVARAEYDLVPSALRTKGENLPFGVVLNTIKEQVEAEAAILLAFYESVYFQGLTVPNWNDVRGSMEEIKKGRPSRRPFGFSTPGPTNRTQATTGPLHRSRFPTT